MLEIVLTVIVVLLIYVTARLYFLIKKLQTQMAVVAKSHFETLNLIAKVLTDKTGRNKNATRKTK